MGNAQSRQDSFLSAVTHGRLKDVEELLKQDGVHVDTTDAHGLTALMQASSCGHAKIARYLLQEGADVNATDENDSTALLLAAKQGHHTAAKALLDHKADVDVRDKQQWTPLMFAAQFGHINTTRLLLERNANVNLANNKGKTSIEFAADNGHLEIVRQLLTKHADVNAIDANGDTPLMCAALNGHISIVNMLLKQGVNIDVENCNGKTAFDLAHEQYHQKITQMIQAVGQFPILTRIPRENMQSPPSAWATLPPDPALMRQVSTLCGTMQEAEEICTRIYSRLFDFGRQLLQTGLIQKQPLRKGYTAILERFRTFLGQYGNKRAITRIVIVRMVISVCQELHEKIDDLIKLCENDIAGDFLEWKKTFQVDSKTYRGSVISTQARDQSWKDDLQDTYTQSEALTLLIFEHKHRAGEYDSDELKCINQLFQSVARLSRLPIPSIPAWFLPPHEVEVQDKIGVGSYGLVSLGLWKGSEVVVKSIIFHADTENRQMFLKEVDIWSSLQHPHIVNFFGASHVGNPFFVCEHVLNGCLSEYLHHEKYRHKTWKYLYEAALGLLYLHVTKRIVHLDIKGDNILVGQDDVAKLTDFGLSCREADLPPSGNAEKVGAIRWKAPEYITGESSGSFACDVYSFGMTIIEVLTHELPYGMLEDSTLKYWARNKLHKLPKQPTEMTHIQWDLVKSMCAIDPVDRIDMETAVQSLKTFADEERINYDHNAWQKEKQKLMSSLLQTPHTPNEDRITMDQVLPFCDTMKEAQTMCLHIYSRLFSLGELLLSENIQSELLQNAYAAILERFHSFLVKYGNKQTLTRIVTARMIVSVCQKLHEELNDFINACEFSVNDTGEWREQFEADSEAHRECLIIMFKQAVNQLMIEAQNTEVQVEALTLLLSTKNQFEGNYNSDELKLINLLFRSVPQLSKLGIPSVPAWFISPREVDFYVNSFACGSYSSVHIGTWMGSDVVVKSSFVHYSNSRPMFVEEAELWSRLQHPHVVKLYGACHVGNPFFVCEYASRGTLWDYLYRDENRFKIWRCLHQAALGLYYLHAKHEIVHRDIKGNNILVDGSGVTKLSDFGSSRHVDDLPPSGDASEIGAINWKAPEILSGESSGSFASDVYSFGMTIIEAVTESVPWNAMPGASVKYMVLKQRRLPKQPSEMSDSQWDLIKRMCSTDPADRIDMAAVVEELEKLAKGERDAEFADYEVNT